MTDSSLWPCNMREAITDSLPPRSGNPTVPVTIAERVGSTQDASAASTNVLWCHARDDEGRPSSEPERLARGLHRQATGSNAPTGLEDNLRLGRDRPARSNAALVHRFIELCETHERQVGIWRRSRKMLGLWHGAGPCP